MKVNYKNTMSISFKKSTKNTSLKHNNRELSEKEKENEWHNHIDFERTHLNKTLVRKDIKEMYEDVFGEAVAEYNAKQKRKDRMIKNYYSKVLKDKKLETQREFIIQVGDMKDFQGDDREKKWNMANEILEKYVEDFEERNPNLKIYNAVIHNDETSPHLHVNVIPVASGYKRGVQMQPSFDKALRQQKMKSDVGSSFDLFETFREQEVARVEKMMNERHFGRKEVGTNKIKDHHEYKELQRELENLDDEVEETVDLLEKLRDEVKDLKEQRTNLVSDVEGTHVEQIAVYNSEYVPKDKYVILERVEFERLQEQNELVPRLVKRNKQLSDENDGLVKENHEQKEQIGEMQKMMEMARRRMEQFVQNGANLWNRCVTYASKFYQKGKEVAPEDMVNDVEGEQDHEKWKRQRAMHQMRGREL
ncbi:plasmid recombination protein [Bacillus cereus]|nr:plasmid recombination protein [Bacillus cereus]